MFPHRGRLSWRRASIFRREIRANVVEAGVVVVNEKPLRGFGCYVLSVYEDGVRAVGQGSIDLFAI